MKCLFLLFTSYKAYSFCVVVPALALIDTKTKTLVLQVVNVLQLPLEWVPTDTIIKRERDQNTFLLEQVMLLLLLL